MSFTPTSDLTPDQTTLLRCRQHAARIFVDDQFRLLPKNKFLFHVFFDINWSSVNPKSNLNFNNLPTDKINPFLVEALKDEVSLLVKGVDIPSYSMQTETLNQYNRKKVVQYQHKHGDIGLTFHDDNMGLINQVWQLYYKYYYADPTTGFKPGAYKRNATLEAAGNINPYAYGYTGRKKPFFKSITIFQMSRKEFVSYHIINPVITSWSGGKLGYHETASHSFDMKFAYESVVFNTGFVNHINDEFGGEIMNNFGLASALYDSTLSPLQNSDPNRDVNTPVNNSPSFARVPWGSADSSMPSNLTATQQTAKEQSPDNEIIAPLPPSSEDLIYDDLLTVTPPIEGLTEMMVPIGTDPTETTVASQANVANTSLDTAVLEESTAEHTGIL